MYEKFRRLPYPYYRGSEIWVKEKVQPLKIITHFFLEPHTRCYVLLVADLIALNIE